MRFEWLSSLAEVTATDWNALFPADYPFCRYEFLLALEQGGSVGSSVAKNTGWLVRHFVVWQDEKLIAAVPAYIKLHSYGEYLFDWSFAEAYQNYGLDYYPKLLLAIPFTPAEGPRLGLAAAVAGTRSDTTAAGCATESSAMPLCFITRSAGFS